jgi:hypothetical protein
VPHAVAVNCFTALFSNTVEVIALLELGRSGVLEYSYAGTVSCSTASQLRPESKSNTASVTIADGGSSTVWSIWVHSYSALAVSRVAPEHDASLVTVVPQQSQPAA